jgi:hypothetical protein
VAIFIFATKEKERRIFRRLAKGMRRLLAKEELKRRWETRARRDPRALRPGSRPRERR